MEEEDDKDLVSETNRFFTTHGTPIFLTEDEEYTEVPNIQRDEDYILENDVVLEAESIDYQRDYMNALTAQKKQYSLRSRYVPVNPIQKRKYVQSKNDSSNTKKKGKELVDLNSSKVPSTSITANEKKNQQKDGATKEKTDKKDIRVKEVEKVSSFNLESEIGKLKVSTPLAELVKNRNYKHHVSRILQIYPLSDMVNVKDDHPELIFGPTIEGQPKDSEVPPSYLILRMHEYILHNVVLDSGASHNLMPKAIMEKLGLDITQKYHDLYSFDSGRVCCIGHQRFCFFFKSNPKQKCLDGCGSC